MFTHLAENIVKKDLHTEWISELIPCSGYKYLSILTDGAFNPDPFPTGLTTLNHYIILKDSNRTIPIYGEMRNIPLGKNTEIRYTNVRANIVAGYVQNGFGNIIFYLSNYPNDFMTIKGNIGFQWEDSWESLAGIEKYYHFGIDRLNSAHILAVPFLANCFNKFVYLLKESTVSQAKEICYYYEDNNVQCVNLVTNTLTELLLPAKRLYLHFHANAITSTEFDMMLKFEKA